MSRGYPLNLELDGRRCLVIGGDEEAVLRANALLEAGALVRVLSEEPPAAALLELERLAQIELRRRAPLDSDFDDVWLVVQASRNRQLARHVAGACRARRVFFCAVDQPEHSSYSHLALARAGSLTLSIGTEGKAPALAARLRQELSRLLEEAGAAEHVERLAALRAATPDAERREVLKDAVADVHFTGGLRFEKR